MDADELRVRLRHVRWIGGGSAAGKSTIAARLAARSGLHVYATDDVMTEHARRCSPADCPSLAAFAALSMDDRWLRSPPEVMFETFHWFRGEGFALILEDLLRLPEEPGVIVEGFRLLPRLVEPLLTDRSQAVWLLPTPEFRRAALEDRGTLWQIADRTSDPPRALTNLLERDRLFTERLHEETRVRGLNTVEIDPTTTAEQSLRQVAAALRLDAGGVNR